MEKDGGTYVSKNKLKEKLLRLNLDGRSKNPQISEAPEIFRSRISGRYLRQIHSLNRDAFRNGFASMALCCLLIDTFYQFENGVKKTTNNRGCYVRFLRNHLGDIFDTQEKADRFYVDIRCGILHSAQTQNGSRLSSDQGYAIRLLGDTPTAPISVDVIAIGDRITEYFEDYCGRVRYDRTTQSNFLKKMRNLFK